MISNFKLSNHRTIQFTKPLAIIYNPNSGKKQDIKSIIKKRLDLAGIPYELLESTKYFMTWGFFATADD